MKRRGYCGLCLLIGLTTAKTAAQQSTPLHGVVVDTSGGLVASAAVTLELKQGLVKVGTTVTDLTGRFEFPGVTPGSYLLVTKATGFEPARVNVRFTGTESSELRIRLQIAALQEDVEVTSNAGSGSSQENMDHLRIGEHWINELPMKQDDLASIPSLFLNPAAIGTGGPQIVVDGIQGSDLDIPASSVKRIYANKNTYAAEFGEPGEGRIEVLTKEGSRSHYHRNATAVVRNSVFDARNPFAQSRPSTSDELFEGEFDGPLGDERARFLVSGRFADYNDSVTVTAVTPDGPVTSNVDISKRGLRILGSLDLRFIQNHVLRTTYKYKQDDKPKQGVGGFELPERAYNSSGREHRITISDIAFVSDNMINELRGSWKLSESNTRSLTAQPAIIVADAFSAGGAQVFREDHEGSGLIEDITTFVRGRQTFRFGGQAWFRSFNSLDRNNFGGTYLFSSIDAFVANSPYLFRLNLGEPSVRFWQNQYFYFVQDEIRFRNVNVSAGLRHDLQSGIADFRDLAPRLAFAYTPHASHTVIRAGAGLFYDRLPSAGMQQLLLFGGSSVRQVFIQAPAFPIPVGSINDSSVAPLPSITRKDTALRSPYLLQSSIGIEQKISASYLITAEFTYMHGVRLFRSRNVNAPRPDTGLRPDPLLLNVDQFESSGSSQAKNLRFTVRGNWSDTLELFGQYTLSSANDDTSGLFSFPADSYNVRGEFGRSDFDRRHNFRLIATAHLPKSLRLGTIVSISSGPPFNITTGSDNNNDNVSNDRPAGIGRNTGKGPGLTNIDLRLSRKIRFKGHDKWPKPDLAIDGFNLLNHVNATNFIGTLTSPYFGRANRALPPRQLQLSLKLKF